MNILQKWLRRCFNHGDSVCGVIFGRRGSGKTDNALLIAEYLWSLGSVRNFATNVKVYSSPMPIAHICDLDTLTGWASTNAGKSLYILDEAGRSFKRRTPMAKLNIELLDRLQIVRKYKLSIVMVTPAEKYLDSASLGSDVLDFVVLKTNFNDPKIATYCDLMLQKRLPLRDVPGTSIKFDTWDIGNFTLKPKLDKITFPHKAIEFCYKNAKDGQTAQQLGIDGKQLNRYYKYSLLYLVENYLTPDIKERVRLLPQSVVQNPK